MAPSVSLGSELLIGPGSSEPLSLDDPIITEILSRAETSFLSTVTPDGAPDVSHRGGQAGFLKYEAASAQISWTEYLGDGMFVSAGNLRSGGLFALLVLDITTGNGVVLHGEANYTNLRGSRHERVDALIQDTEPFAVQGKTAGTVKSVILLKDLCHPRQKVDKIVRITACSTTDEQQPN
jgi:hypothetical protein